MVKCSKRKYVRTTIFVIISTLIVLSGGFMTLLMQMHQTQNSHADGSSVIGPPTLPAATVDSILAQMGSPMTGTGKVVEQAARQYNIDDAFALGVWWTETNDGAAGVGSADRNPGSVRGSVGFPAAFDGYTIYPSYSAAIWDWFSLIRSRYVSRGLTSVYTICYPYVGTSGASSWAAKVMNLMIRYRGEAPPPTPTTKPVPPKPQHASIQPIVVSTATTAVVTPTAQQKQQSAPVATGVQQQSQAHTTATPMSSKALPLGMALCAALLLALWAFRMRRGLTVTVQPVITTQWQPQAQASIYPPLYVNQYSPVLEQQTSPFLDQITAELATGPFVFPAVEQIPFPGEKVLATAHVEEIITADLANDRAPQYSAAGIAGRRFMQLPAYDSSTDDYAPSTENLPPLRGISLPGRTREPVGARAGGLLRRYGKE